MVSVNRTQPAVLILFKKRQLHLKHRISVSNRLSFRWKFKSSKARQQHYRRSRGAFIVSDKSPEATEKEMEIYDEEVSPGHGWSGSVRHGYSCVGCRCGRTSLHQGATPAGRCDLRLDRVLYRRQRWWRLRPQMLGPCGRFRCRSAGAG